MPFTCVKVDQKFKEMQKSLHQFSVRLKEKIEYSDVAEIRKMEQKLEREKDELVLEMVYGHWKRYKNGEVVAAYRDVDFYNQWCSHQDGIAAIEIDEDGEEFLVIKKGSNSINRFSLVVGGNQIKTHPNGTVVCESSGNFVFYTNFQEKFLFYHELKPTESWSVDAAGVFVEKENKIYRNGKTEVFAGLVDEGWMGYKKGFVVVRGKTLLLNGKKVILKIPEANFDKIKDFKPHPRGFVIELLTDSGMQLLLNGKTVLYDGPKYSWDSHPDGVIVLKDPTWVFYNESKTENE